MLSESLVRQREKAAVRNKAQNQVYTGYMTNSIKSVCVCVCVVGGAAASRAEREAGERSETAARLPGQR